MRELGLSAHLPRPRPRAELAFALLLLPLGCKTAPETAPPGASAPTTAAAPIPAAPASTPATPPGAAPSGAAPSAGPRVYPDSTTNVSARVGEAFSIALPANVTVPYRWRLEPAPDAHVLVTGGEQYVEQPPAGCPSCVGYGGTRLFAFTAAGPGSVTLHFALLPLSGQGEPAKTATIEVEVK